MLSVIHASRVSARGRRSSDAESRIASESMIDMPDLDSAQSCAFGRSATPASGSRWSAGDEDRPTPTRPGLRSLARSKQHPHDQLGCGRARTRHQFGHGRQVWHHRYGHAIDDRCRALPRQCRRSSRVSGCDGLEAEEDLGMVASISCRRPAARRRRRAVLGATGRRGRCRRAAADAADMTAPAHNTISSPCDGLERTPPARSRRRLPDPP